MPALDYSKIKQYGTIDFLAKQLVEGFITGLHKSPFHGFSVEFAEHRLYNAGESTRFIDWKVFAKTDKVFVKRYEEETNLRCHILVDVSSSMYYPQHNYGKLNFSILAAATLANMLQRQRDAVGLISFSDQIEIQLPPKSTGVHLLKIYQSLEQLLDREKNNYKTKIADTLHRIADKINRRSLVVIFSDMFEDVEKADEIFSALRHLKHNLHEVLVFHVTDRKTEIDFEFEDRPYEFIDLETQEKVKIQPSQVKDGYKKLIQKFKNDLKLKCGQYKIDFTEADINEGFDHILNTFLAKRSRLV